MIKYVCSASSAYAQEEYLVQYVQRCSEDTDSSYRVCKKYFSQTCTHTQAHDEPITCNQIKNNRWKCGQHKSVQGLAIMGMGWKNEDRKRGGQGPRMKVGHWENICLTEMSKWGFREERSRWSWVLHVSHFAKLQ